MTNIVVATLIIVVAVTPIASARFRRFSGGGGGGWMSTIVADTLKLIFKKGQYLLNKAGFTATPVVCGWAGAVFGVTGPFVQEK